MSHKKRVYPQAQLQMGQQPMDPNAFYPQAGNVAMNMQQQSQPLSPQQASQQPQQMQPGMAVPSQMFTPAQQQLNQQLDQTAYSMANLQLNNNAMDPSAYYQQQQQQQQQLDQYGQYQNPNIVGMNQNQAKPQKPMNQLFSIDLLTSLPPHIEELQYPPPPIMVEPSNFLVPSDAANASPDYLRSTLNAVPRTNSLLKKSKLPFAIVIRPYQHLQDNIDPPPLSEDMIVSRCRRCRSYMNPFVKIDNDANRRWRCNFCRLANDIPMAMDEPMGNENFVNRYERNEIKYAVMEYLAPKEYTLRQPPPSIYTFILDVSQNAIRNGLLATATRSILDNLEYLPNHDGRTRVSILCVDNAIHYFAVPNDEESDQIEMMDICDLDEPFLPRPNSLVASLRLCRNNLEKVLNKIPEIFQANSMTKFALGPGLKAAYNLISGIGGKIIVISATLPNIGIGALQKRQENNVTNTPKESSALLSCQDNFYKNFTVDCSKLQIAIDIFVASDDYKDIATLSNLTRFTGGQIHQYPGFIATNLIDVTKFTKEFSKHITMDLSTETVMRARGSPGVRTDKFYGHFFNRSSDLCAFSALPRDQEYVFELTLDENLIGEYCYIQVATLLSLNTGQRRIRVITLCLPTSDNISDIFASADQLAITAVLTQKAIQKAINSSLNEARDFLTRSIQDILLSYKKEIVSSNVTGTSPLRLSSNLRMLPLLIHCLTKNAAFRASIIPSDHRSGALNYLETAPLKYLIKNIYPNVYSLHDMPDDVGLPDENGSIVLPQPVNASSASFDKYGLYLIDNSKELFLWMGGDAVSELISDVFGTPEIFQIPTGKAELPVVPSSTFNERVRNIISKVREHDDVVTYQQLYIVRGISQSEPVAHVSAKELSTLRLWANSELVEDKILNNESYREFLQIIKGKLNK
ncbi:COPII subunit SFB2 NDAI_0D01130 [Naumovozyma dairenensis CBS 421]|uniref:Protein transport protein SEC24 n=1 Tax=Naumovozyma dairenensis (strain ATCC 10597 / BCRC 20456 / CBS 421 / NBRC 0211 / NRRL Y-12639) TaxID=1071378 RepID=G0W9G5_NAUDC|nr:hypothetical protein NDAI_0D01130 [Naumovozyma dairenensis CBS 421]CCD24426.1 hypothetical protein NDAI_0D01130 [Naumovozyma dairenensis CBS 421]